MVVHPPTLYDVFARLLPVGLQALAACALLVMLLAFWVRRDLRKSDGVIPDERLTVRNVCELLLEGVVSLMRQTIGPEWPRFVPLVGTLGLFILISNLMGLVPGLTGPTSFIETNVSWAVLSFVTYNYAGIRHHGPGAYLSHFAGPVWWLAPLILPIELFSHLVRVMSLTIRLTANMFADHTLVALFLSFGLGLNFLTPWVFMGLGVFIAFLQAFIFTFLTIVYIGLALEESH
jgi:F-type H+-transporting ATPase subunit a